MWRLNAHCAMRHRLSPQCKNRKQASGEGKRHKAALPWPVRCARARPMSAESDTPPAVSSTEASTGPKPAKSLGPLRMIWRAALAYPSRIVIAGLALMTTAGATLAIPWEFRQIIDKGFARGSDPALIDRWFGTLILIVVVLAAGT